ncbi:MAG: SAF domain-containing protein [Actinobacteria bacterium]|nr:SAF domain-containing protein [Actinomycetota bacterium]MDA2984263.1 SAF domain-containing protein [Actinomycetota bacterium]
MNSMSKIKEIPSFSNRTVIGVALIILSIFAAAALLRSTDKTELFWVAKTAIAEGDKIRADQVAMARLYLPGIKELYMPASEPIIGSYAKEAIESGEAIKASEIGLRQENILWRLVSLEINKGDLPTSAIRGTLVDIYQLTDSNRSLPIVTNLLLDAIPIYNVVGGAEISGSVQIILRVPLVNVRSLLEAYATGKIAITSHEQ